MSHIHYHSNPISVLKKYYQFEFPPMQIVPITEGKIRSKISSLKNSSGYDGSTKILKLCGNHIRKSLAFIFNKSVTMGVFPERLKYAVAIPLHKKDDVSNMAIYEGGSKYFRTLNLLHKRDIVQGSATTYSDPTIF